jgi:hypothetical protein
MMKRARIARLESVLIPKPPRIIGATIDVRNDQLREMLYEQRGNHPAPPGLTVADLPPDCFIYRYAPSTEAASLYQSMLDCRAHVQRVLGLDEDVFLRRDLQRTQTREDR